jgi:hypothetical protein
MIISPYPALCSAYARISPRHAHTRSFRSATGAQRLFPATASAEGAQFNGRPFPASATAEGAQLNVPPSSAGTLVRVLEPPVKARISQRRKTASLNFSDLVARHISRRRGVSPHRYRTHRLQRRPPLRCLLVPIDPTFDLRQTARNGAWHIDVDHASSFLCAASGMRRRGCTKDACSRRATGAYHRLSGRCPYTQR